MRRLEYSWAAFVVVVGLAIPAAAQGGALYSVELKGGIPHLLEIDLSGSTVDRGTIINLNGSQPANMQALTFDYEGRLWATGDSDCGQAECLYEFAGR